MKGRFDGCELRSSCENDAHAMLKPTGSSPWASVNDYRARLGVLHCGE